LFLLEGHGIGATFAVGSAGTTFDEELRAAHANKAMNA
jgi:hypothetical protein